MKNILFIFLLILIISVFLFNTPPIRNSTQTAEVAGPFDKFNFFQSSENIATLEGTALVLHYDGNGISKQFNDLDSYYQYFLEDSKGNLTEMIFDEDPPSLVTGETVRVTGEVDGDIVQINSGIRDLTIINPTTDVLSNSFGSKKTLVILINYLNNTSQPFSTSFVRSIMNSISNFDKENSFKQTWLTDAAGNAEGADVTNWLTLPVNAPNPCAVESPYQIADTAATNAGFDLSQYSRIIYAFPHNSACYWAGVGMVGGSGPNQVSRSWINGGFTTLVVGHEMGHNFGLYHSHSLQCSSSGCLVSEYGDNNDIMGNQFTGHFNAFQKERLGWLNYGISPPIISADASGQYTISPYESNDGNPKALKILKNTNSITGTSTYYYVEYRANLGFDFGLGSKVILHTGDQASANSSNLWDLDQITTNFVSMLSVGQTFIDPNVGIKLTLTSVGTTGALVTLLLDTSCVRNNPILNISPQSQPGFPGQALNYNISVTNTDNIFCNNSEFGVTPTLPGANWQQSPPSISLNLPPGDSQSQLVSIISPPNLLTSFNLTLESSSSMAYSFSESAANLSFSGYNSTTSAIYLIQTPDTTAPAINIFSPANGASYRRGKIKISASATDASGIALIQILFDGNVIKNCYLLSICKVNQPSGPLSIGTHTITVRATDRVQPTPNTPDGI